MCWSETASWTTFGIGTAINVLAFAYLRIRRSLVAPLVLYWQFTLLMQVPEGVAWSQIDAGATDLASVSRSLMVLNVLQPVVLTAVVWVGFSRVPCYALVATLMYVLLMANEAGALWREAESVRPAPDCPHLDLAYWTGARTTLFYFASFFSFAAIPSLLWAAVNALIFTVTLLIAVGAYHCGGGSMWCWLIFVAGLILVAVDVVVRTAWRREADRVFGARRLSLAVARGRLVVRARE